MRPLLALALLLAFTPTAARAEDLALDGGAPDAGLLDVELALPPCPADAGVVELHPSLDGGATLPAPILRCQRAPVDGVFLTFPRARQLAAERERASAELAEAIKQQEPIPTIPAWVWLTCSVGGTIVGTIAGAYIAKKAH